MEKAFNIFLLYLILTFMTACVRSNSKQLDVQQAASQGDAEAQFKLGQMYDYSEHDNNQALAWYRKAADQGLAEAQYQLGRIYGGTRFSGDDELGPDYFIRLSPLAQSSIYRIFVPIDRAQAAEWYHKAATQGHAKAQTNLGVYYQLGLGVPKDITQALAWFRKAADQGYAEAQTNLGLMYANGEGVPKDATQAVVWYRKAADQGLADAQYALAWMYATGEGVPKDAVKAYMWITLSADQNFKGAVEVRDEIAKLLTPSQLEEGRRLTQDWLEHH